jgi:hypothetical protein
VSPTTVMPAWAALPVMTICSPSANLSALFDPLMLPPPATAVPRVEHASCEGFSLSL